MGIKENTEAGSEVGISKCVSLRVNYMFMQWQRLHQLIKSMLHAMKDVFKAECDSNFRMYKFHTVLHTPLQLTEFGNLDILDANR